MLKGTRLEHLGYSPRRWLCLATRAAIRILDEAHDRIVGPEAACSMLRDLRRTLLAAMAKADSTRNERHSWVEHRIFSAVLEAAMGAALIEGEGAIWSALRRLRQAAPACRLATRPRKNATSFLVPLLLVRKTRLRSLILEELPSGSMKEAC